MREIDIKKQVVQSLASQGGVEAIAAEFQFDFGRRRADLACLQDGLLYGYEIKSAFDKLDNLQRQMDSYRLIFDYIYVVCDRKHLASVRKIIPRKVGIYLCDDTGLKLLRKPGKIGRFDSMVMLDVMPASHLKAEFGVKSKTKHQLCSDIKKSVSALRIRKALIQYLGSRYGAATYFFKREITSVVTLDDIFLLFSASAKDLAV